MAKARKDAFKKLTHVVIAVAVLAVLFAAATIWIDRLYTAERENAEAARAATNSELVRQHAEAEREYRDATRVVVDDSWPAPVGSGVEVLDLTGHGLKSSRTVNVSRSELLSSGMLLLNRWHSLPSDFPEADIVSIVSINNSIPVSGSSVKLFPVAISAIADMLHAASENGLENYLTHQGYRTMTEQTSLYQAEEARYSSRYSGDALVEKVTANVNYPGTSEYQSGLSFQIGRWRKDDAEFNKARFEDTAHSDWLVENCWKYGFVFRFPVTGYPNATVTDKSFKTGESKQLRIYRYVGQPNAAVMHAMGFCMEEYIEYLAAHPHIAYYEDGVLKYEIQRISGGDTASDVSVQVTQDCGTWVVSSDNMGGIIVAMVY